MPEKEGLGCAWNPPPLSAALPACRAILNYMDCSFHLLMPLIALACPPCFFSYLSCLLFSRICYFYDASTTRCACALNCFRCSPNTFLQTRTCFEYATSLKDLPHWPHCCRLEGPESNIGGCSGGNEDIPPPPPNPGFLGPRPLLAGGPRTFVSITL